MIIKIKNKSVDPVIANQPGHQEFNKIYSNSDHLANMSDGRQSKETLSESSGVKLCKTTNLPRKYTKKDNFTTPVLNILNSWMMSHRDFPYPTAEELSQLSLMTGLAVKQIRIWCTNTRKRRLKITREEYLLNHNVHIQRKIAQVKKQARMGSKGYRQRHQEIRQTVEAPKINYSVAPMAQHDIVS